MLPKVSYIDAKIALLDIYETVFGIYDHLTDSYNKAQRPLASVALHDSESICEGSDLYLTIDRFIKHDVYKSTGLSLTQFLELPRELVLKIFKTIEISDAKDNLDKEKTLNTLLANQPKK